MECEASPVTLFVPMTEVELVAFVEAAIPELARDKVQSGQWTEAESLSLARQGYAELLPQGIHTPDNFLYTLHDAAIGSKVGVLWHAHREQAGSQVAYVYEVLVYPEHRRQGHATRALVLLEQEVHQLGLAGVALHVFGHNTVAQNLYAQLGFQATNVNMFKTVCLPGADATAATGKSRSQR
jgi:ribosomal protein S18 acetylase RimI-like enzyme